MTDFPLEENREIYSFETAKDPQGIKWDSPGSPYTRASFRQSKGQTYRSFRNTSDDLTQSDEIYNKSCSFFSFKKNYPVKCESGHFQLRDLVKVKSDQEVFLRVNPNTISCYNPIKRRLETIHSPSFRVVSFDIYEENLLLGGMEGQLMLLDIFGDIKFSYYLSDAASRITTSVKVFNDYGPARLLVSNNDHFIRVIEPESKQNLIEIECTDCVNYAAVSNDRNKIAACLDSYFDYIFDRRTGETCMKLKGHKDFGFCVEWNPSDEYQLATGNQDKSIMIWDIRTGDQPLNVIKGSIGSIYSLKYSKNGKYLAFAESCDFLNIIDLGNIKEFQVNDYFGDISGFGFDETDEDNLKVFLGISERNLGSLIELHENSQPNLEI